MPENTLERIVTGSKFKLGMQEGPTYTRYVQSARLTYTGFLCTSNYNMLGECY